MLSFQVLNTLSNDSYSLFEAALFGPLPATIPIVMAVCAVYASFILGPTALIGMSVYVTFIPIQVTAGLRTVPAQRLQLTTRSSFAGHGPQACVPAGCSQKCFRFLAQHSFSTT